jgi:protein-S-isoprenylcysteine O-methyltransferase Ste14
MEGPFVMRAFWIAFGIGTHLLFAVTVARLVPFLAGTMWPRGGTLASISGGLGWFWVDALLAIQFGAVHSTLLLPGVRSRLSRLIPAPQYGCVFCAATCASLLLAIELWRPSRGGIWHLQSDAAGAVSAAFVLSWVALIYSLQLTGLGYQTGWAPWWAWARGRPAPRRSFAPRGAYRLLRHPVYLSFLGLVWFTPVMSFDRAVLTAVWTAYIFLGSWLKDRRLEHYIGAGYRAYAERVPGYPFFAFGPLGKVRRYQLIPEPSPGRASADNTRSRASAPLPRATPRHRSGWG